MTTKYLSGVYPAGYSLAAGYSELVIDRNALVLGYGVAVAFSATVVRAGSGNLDRGISGVSA